MLTSRARFATLLITMVLGIPGTAGAVVAADAANSAPTCTGAELTKKRLAPSLTIALSCQDAEGDPLTYSLVQEPRPWGTLDATAINEPAHTVTFSNKDNEPANGTTSFTFKASDGAAESATATVTVHITNAAPVCQIPETTTIKHDSGPVSIPLVCSDPDGDPITLAGGVPYHGTADTSHINDVDSRIIYTPKAGFAGRDQFTFGASDGYASGSSYGYVDVTNVEPICEFEGEARLGGTVPPKELSHDTTAVTPIVCSDADGDALTLTATSAPTSDYNGTPAGGTLDVSALDSTDPRLIYTPAAKYVGWVYVNFSVSDGVRPRDYRQNLRFNNALPACRTEAYYLTHSRPHVITLKCTDADGDPVKATVAGAPMFGAVDVTHIDDATPSVTYTPNAGYLGDDSLTLQGNDGIASGPSLKHRLIVINNKPRCVQPPGPYTTIEPGQPVTVELDCSDPDGDAVTLLVDINSPGRDYDVPGTVTTTGRTFTYTPPATFRGLTDIGFRPTDGLETGNQPVWVTFSVYAAADFVPKDTPYPYIPDDPDPFDAPPAAVKNFLTTTVAPAILTELARAASKPLNGKVPAIVAKIGPYPFPTTAELSILTGKAGSARAAAVKKLGGASLKLAAKKPGTLTAKLNKAGKALLKKKRKLKVTLVLKLTAQGVNVSKAKTVTLKLKK